MKKIIILALLALFIISSTSVLATTYGNTRQDFANGFTWYQKLFGNPSQQSYLSNVNCCTGCQPLKIDSCSNHPNEKLVQDTCGGGYSIIDIYKQGKPLKEEYSGGLTTIGYSTIDCTIPDKSWACYECTSNSNAVTQNAPVGLGIKCSSDSDCQSAYGQAYSCQDSYCNLDCTKTYTSDCVDGLRNYKRPDGCVDAKGQEACGDNPAQCYYYNNGKCSPSNCVYDSRYYYGDLETCQSTNGILDAVGHTVGTGITYDCYIYNADTNDCNTVLRCSDPLKTKANCQVKTLSHEGNGICEKNLGESCSSDDCKVLDECNGGSSASKVLGNVVADVSDSSIKQSFLDNKKLIIGLIIIVLIALALVLRFKFNKRKRR